MSPIREGGGGSNHPPLRKKYKKYSARTENRFLLKPFFGIVTPSLSTGSKEIFMKNRAKKVDFFLFFVLYKG